MDQQGREGIVVRTISTQFKSPIVLASSKSDMRQATYSCRASLPDMSKWDWSYRGLVSQIQS